MGDPAWYRDSTQIVLHREAIEEIQSDIESQFTVTIHVEGSAARIIGSPVVIKEVTDFLTREGVSLP